MGGTDFELCGQQAKDEGGQTKEASASLPFSDGPLRASGVALCYEMCTGTLC